MKSLSLKDIIEKNETYHDTSENTVEQMSLEQLFQELAKETQVSRSTDDKETEFQKVQKEVTSLPKIQCELELISDSETRCQKATPYVVNVNDPIFVNRKKKEESTDAGSMWFNMRKPEITTELKRDLLVLKNRSVLDPKRHYKKEKWEIPKFFETGTVIEGNTEFYSARMTRKARGRTLAEEILNDSAAQTYFKRRYREIQKKNTSGGKKHYNKLQAKRQGH